MAALMPWVMLDDGLLSLVSKEALSPDPRDTPSVSVKRDEV